MDNEHQQFLSREKMVKTGLVTFGLSVFLFFALMLILNFKWQYLLLLTTAFGGTILGFLLTAKDVGIRYDIVESFCNSGQNINCDWVLNSDEAILFGQFKLSDAVLSYFFFQLIATGIWIQIGSDATAILSILFVFSMFSIPVVGYSFYMQGVKLKSWCRLCLLVGTVLLVQAILFGWMYTTGIFVISDLGIWPVTQTILLVAIIGSIEFLLKSKVQQSSEAIEAEIVANRVKYNPEVFTHLLLTEKREDTTPFEREILIGKPHTPIQVTMAASLVCGPCKEGFEKAVQLIQSYPQHVNLSIRFAIPTPEKRNETIQPAEFILSVWLDHIYTKEDQSVKTVRILKDWYSLLNLEKFNEKYPFEVNGQSKKLQYLVEQHADWFNRAGIHRTPTFFINSYRLPIGYRIKDIINLMPGLLEKLPLGKRMNQKEQQTLSIS